MATNTDAAPPTSVNPPATNSEGLVQPLTGSLRIEGFDMEMPIYTAQALKRAVLGRGWPILTPRALRGREGDRASSEAALSRLVGRGTTPRQVGDVSRLLAWGRFRAEFAAMEVVPSELPEFQFTLDGMCPGTLQRTHQDYLPLRTDDLRSRVRLALQQNSQNLGVREAGAPPVRGGSRAAYARLASSDQKYAAAVLWLMYRAEYGYGDGGGGGDPATAAGSRAARELVAGADFFTQAWVLFHALLYLQLCKLGEEERAKGVKHRTAAWVKGLFESPDGGV